MMMTPESTSAEAFDQFLVGRLIAASNGWKNLLVRIYSEPRVEESVTYPAVAEPRIVRILSGAAIVEERELAGPWLKTRVEAGDFFLTASQSPYEVRWRAIGSERFETMHLYLGLPVLNRAIEEAFPTDQGTTHLRDLSGFKDNFLSALLEGLHKELLSHYRTSSLFVEGIAHSLAGHLVRTYADEITHEYKGGLPGFRLRKVRALMLARLADEFSLIRLAREADMSEFHFSRAFKRTTGLTPSQYFIDLRLEKARRLLRETNRSAIEVGLEVGYTSPSHFARIFRREVGISPSEYRRLG
ncbi:MAG TPA: AraC family transcriptional regulator [Chthoniobacterales bacterium]|jgi:AraC family transcriptional regulator|nr:AraC family transcriptional regulator [Chthoniobacterales bacterium]